LTRVAYFATGGSGVGHLPAQTGRGLVMDTLSFWAFKLVCFGESVALCVRRILAILGMRVAAITEDRQPDNSGGIN